MNKEIMTDYYRNNPKDILNEQLADDKPYHALIQKKIAAENALRSLISEEAWKRYLNLDSVCSMSRCQILGILHCTPALSLSQNMLSMFCLC